MVFVIHLQNWLVSRPGALSIAMDSDMEKIFSGSTVLLCVDLQVCYYQQPVTQLFPHLEENVEKVLTFCRESHIQVAHVRQEDVPGDDGLPVMSVKYRVNHRYRC